MPEITISNSFPLPSQPFALQKCLEHGPNLARISSYLRFAKPDTPSCDIFQTISSNVLLEQQFEIFKIEIPGFAFQNFNSYAVVL